MPPDENPDYAAPGPGHYLEPPASSRYTDERIYGSYATRTPPVYVPHPLEHSCFRPRKEDYKPPVTCDEPPSDLCVRKDHRHLTTDEQNRFVNAFTQVNAMARSARRWTSTSTRCTSRTATRASCRGHRIYLLRLEALLMMVDPTVCIPYWKSSEEQAFPSWLLGFTPTVTLAAGPHLVTRNIGAFSTLPDAASVTAALAPAKFNPFGSALEGVHNSGWSETEVDTRDIEAQVYTYA